MTVSCFTLKYLIRFNSIVIIHEIFAYKKFPIIYFFIYFGIVRVFYTCKPYLVRNLWRFDLSISIPERCIRYKYIYLFFKPSELFLSPESINFICSPILFFYGVFYFHLLWLSSFFLRKHSYSLVQREWMFTCPSLKFAILCLFKI